MFFSAPPAPVDDPCPRRQIPSTTAKAGWTKNAGWSVSTSARIKPADCQHDDPRVALSRATGRTPALTGRRERTQASGLVERDVGHRATEELRRPATAIRASPPCLVPHELRSDMHTQPRPCRDGRVHAGRSQGHYRCDPAQALDDNTALGRRHCIVVCSAARLRLGSPFRSLGAPPHP